MRSLHDARHHTARAGAARYAFARSQPLFDALMHATPVPAAGSVGNDSDEPIFVIGMPRSGTTLVDRILSSHPQVHSAGELQNFGAAFKQASGSRTPQVFDLDCIARAAGIDWTQLGTRYLESTRPDTGRTPRFVDKLPHTFPSADRQREG